jgi:hypothetical protein
MTTPTMTLAAFRTVVTKDYLDSIGGADLFSKSLIGKQYSVLGAKRRDANDSDSPLLLEVHNGLRAMTWFLNNFLNNAIEHETSIAMLDHVRNDKVPAKFEVVEFEPSTDRYGAPLYSMQIFDFAKIRKLHPDEFAIITDREASFVDRGIANTVIREDAKNLFMDRYKNGDTVSEEAYDKFRLGTIKIKVTEWLANK